MIRCTVAEAGMLTGCDIVSESPAGYEFGQAALDLAPRFRMRTATTGGRSTAGAVVMVPIVFRLDEKHPVPPAPSPK